MIKVIHVVDENGNFTDPELEIALHPGCRTIFLAGPSPRKDFTHHWRMDAVEYMKSVSEDATKSNFIKILVFDPVNPKFQNTDEYRLKQVLWETKALRLCDKILFYIPRSDELPGLTTNFEIGEWFKDDKTYIALPDFGIKNDYIKCRLILINKPYYDTLEFGIKMLLCHLFDDIKNNLMNNKRQGDYRDYGKE